MTKEVLSLIEEMIKTVAELDNGEIDKVDNIWDINYDKLVELAVDENCQDKATCDEEAVHDEMADIRVLYYSKVEEFSYKCSKCSKTFYGRKPIENNYICRNCKN